MKTPITTCDPVISSGDKEDALGRSIHNQNDHHKDITSIFRKNENRIDSQSIPATPQTTATTSSTNTTTTTFTTALIAGGFAGMSVDVVLFPIDTIKTRLQAPQGFWQVGGFRGMYNGIGAVVIGSAPGKNYTGPRN
jgi:Mitochondrial carrier protein